MNKQTADSIMKIFSEFDAKGSQNEYFDLLRRRVEFIVDSEDPLILFTFTCSTIKAREMFGATPWEYVSLDPEGNNLTDDIERLTLIVKRLRIVYPNTRLRVVVGNTDPYYIYTQQFSALSFSKEFLWEKFCERWEKYRENLETWIKVKVPDCNCEVVSWYEFEKEIERIQNRSFESEYEEVFNNIQSYIKKSDFDWELQQLKTQFTSGKYFDGLICPKDAVLQDWIRRKFAEYAVQALWIYMFMPNAFLIQNEKPSDLRTSMYQPLVREQYFENFPVLYFCGVDNQGYQ